MFGFHELLVAVLFSLVDGENCSVLEGSGFKKSALQLILDYNIEDWLVRFQWKIYKILGKACGSATDGFVLI